MIKVPNESIFWSELENGLKVVTVEMPNFYTVSAGLFANVGSRFEDHHQMGISHFIEHLLFKGSKNYSARKISEIIEGRGGFLNAYTSEESTCFYFKTMPNSFFESLDVLLDLYTSPLFDPHEIEKEKDVVIEELHSYEDQPSAYIDDLFGMTMWQGHPLGHLILGTESTILKHTKSELLDFFNQHYTAQNSVLAVAGAIKHEEVLSYIKKEQKRFKQGVKNQYQPFIINQVSPRLHLYTKEIEQCNLQFGVPTAGRYSEHQWPLRILNTVAGENMSSRLFQEIRERLGLAYHISSSQDFYDDVGCFSLQCGVDKENVEECVKESLRVLQRLKIEEISQEELERAKAFAIGQALQDMESTLSHMLFAGDKYLGNDREFSTAYYCKKINQVTQKEVKEMANLYFDSSRLNLALIGPYNSKANLLKNLSFGI